MPGLFWPEAGVDNGLGCFPNNWLRLVLFGILGGLIASGFRKFGSYLGVLGMYRFAKLHKIGSVFDGKKPEQTRTG